MIIRGAARASSATGERFSCNHPGTIGVCARFLSKTCNIRGGCGDITGMRARQLISVDLHHLTRALAGSARGGVLVTANAHVRRHHSKHPRRGSVRRRGDQQSACSPANRFAPRLPRTGSSAKDTTYPSPSPGKEATRPASQPARIQPAAQAPACYTSNARDKHGYAAAKIQDCDNGTTPWGLTLPHAAGTSTGAL